MSPPDGDDFFRQVQQVYDEVGMGDGQDGPKPPEAIAAPDVKAIGGSGFFAQPTMHRYVWSQDYTAEEYLALLSTYSGHIAASPWQRKTLFTGIRDIIAARPSATVRKHYLNMLQIARHIGRSARSCPSVVVVAHDRPLLGKVGTTPHAERPVSDQQP